MKAFLLWFALLWPFHHHKAAPLPKPAPLVQAVPVDPDAPTAEEPGLVTPYGIIHFPDRLCPQNDAGLYFFLGPDGAIGISPKSCDGAFDDWNHLKAPKIDMYTI